MNYNANTNIPNEMPEYQPMGYPYMPTGCGCGCQQLPPACPTYTNCSQVVNKCTVQDYPHITNYHTHVVDNVIRRHVNMPQYTTSYGTQWFDEYVNNEGYTPYTQNTFGPEYTMPYFNQPNTPFVNPTTPFGF